MHQDKYSNYIYDIYYIDPTYYIYYIYYSAAPAAIQRCLPRPPHPQITSAEYVKPVQTHSKIRCT